MTDTAKIHETAIAVGASGKVSIHFTVPAVPVPQPRARATTANGHARMYEAKGDHAIHAFKSSVRMAAAQVFAGAPLDCPLSVSIRFVFPRPSAMRWKRREMPRCRHTKDRGDVDNCLKAVLDALNARVWRDDCLVCEAHVEKWIASGHEQPHVDILIQQL